MVKTILKYNILQSHKDGCSQTMLGCSVDRETAEKICQEHYVAKLPETNRRRVANGHLPLEVIYSVVEVAFEVADWMPSELVG